MRKRILWIVEKSIIYKDRRRKGLLVLKDVESEFGWQIWRRKVERSDWKEGRIVCLNMI